MSMIHPQRAPRVSVLINTYNYGRYIEQAIDSVLAQRLPPEQMEIIVVDDGSTDDTRARVMKYGKSVQYIYKDNGGQMSAYNLGFEHARGTIVCFLDSDDYWKPGKVAAIVEEFDRSPRTDVVYHLMDVIDAEGRVIGRVPDTGEREPVVRVNGEEVLRLLNRLIAPSSGISVRASCLCKVMPGPTEITIAADAYLHRMLPLESNLTAFLNTSLGVYRKHGASHPFGASHTGKVSTLLNMYRLIADYASQYTGTSPLKSILLARLQAEITDTEIVLAALEGKRGEALQMVLRFEPFPRPRNAIALVATRVKMILYALLGPVAFERWKRLYRTIVPHRTAQKAV